MSRSHTSPPLRGVRCLEMVITRGLGSLLRTAKDRAGSTRSPALPSPASFAIHHGSRRRHFQPLSRVMQGARLTLQTGEFSSVCTTFPPFAFIPSIGLRVQKTRNPEA